ncbi:MAG: glycosyltransferase family 4 protein [Planctomycetota bacterium]
MTAPLDRAPRLPSRRTSVPDHPPQRVLVNLSAFDGLASGARERALGLAAGLQRLGAEVLLAEARGTDLAGLVRVPGGATPLRVLRTTLDPGRPLHRAVASERILREHLRRERPDAFLTDFYPVPRVEGVRTAVTVHDLRDLDRAAAHRPVRRAYFRTLYGRRLRRADVVIVPSAFTGREVERRLGVPSRRIAVVHNAVPDALRVPADADEARIVRERLDLPRRPYFLALGVLERRKNLDRLLVALADLHESEPPGSVPTLVIAGRGGPEENRLRRKAADLLPASAVRWAGYVSPQDLSSVYAGALALVHPALYEGYGMPVIEAMAQEVPVACSSSTALPEVAGDAALLFDARKRASIARALLLMMSNDDLRRELKARGRAHARDLTFDVSARLLLDALAPARYASR